MTAGNQSSKSGLRSGQVRSHLAEVGGWQVARETVADLSDQMFGMHVRPDGESQRRWEPDQVEDLVALYRVRDATGLSLSEIVEQVTAPEGSFDSACIQRSIEAAAVNERLRSLRSKLRIG